MQKKKIAILTPTFNYYSGIDRVVERQALDFVKKGNKVKVIALEGNIKPKNYKIEILGMPKNLFFQRIYRLFFFLDIKKLNYYTQLKNFDIVISHFYPMNMLAYLAKKKFSVKYIYFNHGINTEKNNFFSYLYMKLFLLFNNLTLKNVDEAFSVSDFLRMELFRQSKIKSKVTYNKIDRERFNKKVNADKIRKKYSFQDKKILLYIGRIAPHKGIDLLIKAFNKITLKIPDAFLLIVGKATFSHYFKKLKSMTNKNIIFTGFVPDNDLKYYYGACDVYVTASLWEGFDIPAAEAQACGKKVVAFDIGSHKEIIKNGILVEKKNIDGFAEAVIKILSEK